MGPLRGFRIVEIGAIGPGPFCAMMLADMGADVLRIDRVTAADLGLKREARHATLNRGRLSVAINLKASGAVDTVLRLVRQADGLMEGFRPGVMERLGLGPEACLAANPRLIYGRITGFGQDGPLAQMAGHDINYLAYSGALQGIGRKGAPPSPPLNLLADMAGGGMYLAFGMVCALLEASRSGKGQVVDVSMVEGVASLMTSVMGMRAAGLLHDRRGENYYDSGAPWFDSYETADGKYVAVGAIEARFYKTLVGVMGIDDGTLPGQHDKKRWSELRERFAAAFRTRTRDEWVALAEGKEVCLAPVLTPDEAARHPHMQARGTFVEIAGVVQPSPQPRFSRTPGVAGAVASEPGADTDRGLAAWGFSAAEIADLRTAGMVS
jgi:alpha-methylacyl-CoA racemase